MFAVGGVLGGFLIWLGSEVGFGVNVCVSAWVSEFMFHFRGRDSGWVFVFVARFGMILDGGIRSQDGFCGVDVVGLV